MKWLNVTGLIIMALILLPNMLYAYKNKSFKNKCTDKAIIISEQCTRYGCMLLMIFNIGIFEFGFKTDKVFMLYFIGNIILICAYLIIWCLYFKNEKPAFAMLLAIIPSAIFIFSGAVSGHLLLIGCGIIFSFSHIYITYKNNFT